jgi:hypothetical protein
MPKPVPFSTWLRRYPPILCRLFASRGHGPNRMALSDREIADASGLTLADVKFLSYSVDWARVEHGLIDPYLRACRVDFGSRRCVARLEWMRANGQFSHLRRSPLWESQFREMIEIWNETAA